MNFNRTMYNKYTKMTFNDKRCIKIKILYYKHLKCFYLIFFYYVSNLNLKLWALIAIHV